MYFVKCFYNKTRCTDKLFVLSYYLKAKSFEAKDKSHYEQKYRSLFLAHSYIFPKQFAEGVWVSNEEVKNYLAWTV